MECRHEGTTYNEDGEIVISEEEYLEIQKVKELKSVYREHFDELRSVKAEVQYCQKLVDQCRQRLIQGATKNTCLYCLSRFYMWSTKTWQFTFDHNSTDCQSIYISFTRLNSD